jgi:hypothetical protein
MLQTESPDAPVPVILDHCLTGEGFESRQPV